MNQDVETARTRDGEGVRVLALNAGSSSLKFAVHDVLAQDARARMTGIVEYGTDGSASLSATSADGRVLASREGTVREPAQALAAVDALLRAQDMRAPVAIAHRIVHGGPKLVRHARIDAGVLALIGEAATFAPLHVPPALALVRAAQSLHPDAVQVACLDTAFHASLPEIARTLPLPSDLRGQGVRRYGFHGLSCESIIRQLGADLPPRLVIAHLGSGASVTAVREGRSVDTSMGFTPSGGTIMGTRCGDIDPGVLAWLMRERGYDAARIEDLVDHRCGLLGVSGLSSDLRVLRAAADSPGARLAIDLFVRSVSQHVAARAVALGGIDLLVFTGGIGEHDAGVRDAVCLELGFLGTGRSGSAEGTLAVRAIQTCEEAVMALHAATFTTT